MRYVLVLLTTTHTFGIRLAWIGEPGQPPWKVLKEAIKDDDLWTHAVMILEWKQGWPTESGPHALGTEDSVP